MGCPLAVLEHLELELLGQQLVLVAFLSAVQPVLASSLLPWPREALLVLGVLPPLF